jgi:aryl-alcohol dehydrogenase-like predicted oxidoreductase
MQVCPGNIGVSLGASPKQPITLDGRFAAIQAPANLADRWPRDPRMVAEFRRPGLDVFIRSVYLKGLLVVPVEELPETLDSFKPVRRELSRLAAEAGLSEAKWRSGTHWALISRTV